MKIRIIDGARAKGIAYSSIEMSLGFCMCGNEEFRVHMPINQEFKKTMMRVGGDSGSSVYGIPCIRVKKRDLKKIMQKYLSIIVNEMIKKQTGENWDGFKDCHS